MGNPFFDRVDWALQGHYARVETNQGTYEGWIEVINYHEAGILMHDCRARHRGESIGSVFIKSVEVVEVLCPTKHIEMWPLDKLEAHPLYESDITPRDNIMQRAARDHYTGGFPVVTEDGVIINGHKRLAACKAVGLSAHPVEVISCTPDQARRLFKAAHREQFAGKHPDGLAEDTDANTDAGAPVHDD